MENEIYNGLPRVSNLVKAICGDVEGGWLDMCKPLDENISVTEEEVLEWSSNFGTEMHAWCLEGQKPEEVTDLHKQAKRYFDKWFTEYLPARIKVEQKVIHKDDLYGGTLDIDCYIDGCGTIVDLKFYGWWKTHFGFILSKDPFPSNKSVKVNLQTDLYKAGLNKKKHKRACLVIHPEGFLYHEFKRDSQKMKEAISLAETLKEERRQIELKKF
jgi:hypothetical protein